MPPPDNTMAGDAPPGMVTEAQSDKGTVKVSSSVFVWAPPQRCFDILASQLEQPPQWDPMVIDAKPLSSRRRQAEATSRVTFRLGSKKINTLAMISSYRPAQSIAWVSSDKPRVKEYWTLEPRSDGTVIRITLSYDAPPWFGGGFLDRLTGEKRVRQDINQVLDKLRGVAEGRVGDEVNPHKG